MKDMLKPFYTDQEQKTLSEYNEKFSQLFKDDERRQIDLEDFERLQMEHDAIVNTAEKRYYESFHGDIDAIIADAASVIKNIEKSEYQAHQKIQTESVKKLLCPDLNETGKTMNAELKKLAVRGYENCRRYILTFTRLQLNACVYYGSKDGAHKIIALAEEKAASFYKRPTPRLPKTGGKKTYELPQVVQHEPGSFSYLISAPASNLIYNYLSYSGNVQEFAKRKNEQNKNKNYAVTQGADVVRLSVEQKKTAASLEVTVKNLQSLFNSKHAQLEKIFTRILIEANKQCLRNGALIKDEVEIPLTDLVGPGQYTSIESARHGFDNAIPILQSISVAGRITKNKKNTLIQSKHVVLFPTMEAKKNTCTVELNRKMTWGLLCSFYTCLPNYYFELSRRAACLLRYIFYLARQNVQSIKGDGYFTISLKAIQIELNLPRVGKTKNPKRDIKDAISNAIDEIEEKHRAYSAPILPDAKGKDTVPDFSLLIVKEHGIPIDEDADFSMPISKYLDKCKLKVSLKNEYAQKFIDMADRTVKKQRETEKRIEASRQRAAQK